MSSYSSLIPASTSNSVSTVSIRFTLFAESRRINTLEPSTVVTALGVLAKVASRSIAAAVGMCFKGNGPMTGNSLSGKAARESTG